MVGAKTLGIASFYLRAVCQDRNLWRVEDLQEITIWHSKYATFRFAHEATPALRRFAESLPTPFIDGKGIDRTSAQYCPLTWIKYGSGYHAAFAASSGVNSVPRSGCW